MSKTTSQPLLWFDQQVDINDYGHLRVQHIRLVRHSRLKPNTHTIYHSVQIVGTYLPAETGPKYAVAEAVWLWCKVSAAKRARMGQVLLDICNARRGQ